MGARSMSEYACAVAAEAARRSSRWALFLLVLVAIPTSYLLFVTAVACLDGIVNIGTSDWGELALVIFLGIVPFAVWAASYRATRRSLSPIGAALYATSLTLPIALIALIVRIAMNAPFFL